MRFIFSVLYVIAAERLSSTEAHGSSEWAIWNGTAPDDSANTIKAVHYKSHPKNCDIFMASPLNVHIDSTSCPIAAGTKIAEFKASSQSTVYYIITGLHSFFRLPNPKSGEIFLRRPVSANGVYNISVIVTNNCGVLLPLSVLVNVKCRAASVADVLLTATSTSHRIARLLKANQTVTHKAAVTTKSPFPCPPKLASPADKIFRVGCKTIPVFPDVAFVAPNAFVGNISIIGSSHYEITQRNNSNFEVDQHGRVSLGGYMLGDGFTGVIALSITDTDSTCGKSIFIDIAVHVDCFPNRTTTTPASSTLTSSEKQRNTLISPTKQPVASSTIVSKYNASLSLTAEQRSDFSQLSTQSAMGIYQIPAGVDL